MTSELGFRKDLYAGTAVYYDPFRPGYPGVLLDDLRARVPIRQTSRVLDLASGTGQIAFAMAVHAAEVSAVDQEAGSIAFAARKAQRLGVGNIRWVTASAEEVALEGTFDLVTIGNAFHRLDRDVVAQRLVPCLAEHGCVALLWGATPWDGDLPWQRALDATFERWTDTVSARDRVPSGWERAIERDPHGQVLRRAGLVYEGRFEFSVAQRWTLESLIGFAYSTSFLNREALGSQIEVFERDLQSQLSPHAHDGLFEHELTFAYELARRRG